MELNSIGDIVAKETIRSIHAATRGTIIALLSWPQRRAIGMREEPRDFSPGW
jgi:hypothetical protein